MLITNKITASLKRKGDFTKKLLSNCESFASIPRWLASKERYAEMRQVLSRYAKSNNKVLTDDVWYQIKDSAELKVNQTYTHYAPHYDDDRICILCVYTYYIYNILRCWEKKSRNEGTEFFFIIWKRVQLYLLTSFYVRF